MFRLVLEKAKEPEIKLPTSAGSSEKREFQKNIYFCFIEYNKAYDCGSQQTEENPERDGNISSPDLPTSWEICMQVRKQQLELDMEQQTGSKSGKEYVKVVFCHPAYLNYMQSTLWEMFGWMNDKLKLRLLGEISITSYIQMIPPLWQKAKKN